MGGWPADMEIKSVRETEGGIFCLQVLIIIVEVCPSNVDFCKGSILFIRNSTLFSSCGPLEAEFEGL